MTLIRRMNADQISENLLYPRHPRSIVHLLLRPNDDVGFARVEQFLLGQNKIAAIVIRHGKVVAEHDRLVGHASSQSPQKIQRSRLTS